MEARRFTRRQLAAASAMSALIFPGVSRQARAAPPITHGGIGLTRQEFDEVWGGIYHYSTKVSGDYYEFENPHITGKVGFADTGRQRAHAIDFQWAPEIPGQEQFNYGDARLMDFILGFAPDDYYLETTMVPKNADYQHVLSSKWLAERFADVSPYWEQGPSGGEVGLLSLYFRVERRQVQFIRIATGIDWGYSYSDYDLPDRN